MGDRQKLLQARLLKVGQMVTATLDEQMTFDGLFDSFLVLFNECSTKELQKDKNIANFVRQYKPVVDRLQQLMLTNDDFEHLKVIGRGAFGEVHLVRAKFDNNVYAMKILNKWEMLRRQETAMFKEERKILLNANEEWLTSLYYCFQDESLLYLVMEYYPGGDLLTLMSKFEEVMSEDMARFYAAELIMGIECIHRLGFVHRDIKPDNILVDRKGHIRLTDFGSCIGVDEHGEVQSSVSVGTPDYISPETLQSVEKKGTYGKSTDWWSLGVVIYEMLFGDTPFYSESLAGTYSLIMNHKNLTFPEDIVVTDDCKDLIRKLLTNKENRLGSSSVDEIKTHPWFAHLDWSRLKETLEPPYVPELADLTDTSHFDEASLEGLPDVLNTPEPKRGPGFSGNHLPFIGFSFSRHIPVILNDGLNATPDVSKRLAFLEREAQISAAEKSRLELALQSRSRPDSPAVATPMRDDSDRESLAKQLESVKSNLREREMRVAELELAKKTAEKSLEELRGRLEQERSQGFDASSTRKKLEESLAASDAKMRQAEVQSQKLADDLKMRELELKTATEKLAEEAKTRAEVDKAQKALKTQVAELKEGLEREQQQRKKAEASRDEVQAQAKLVEAAQGDKGKAEMDQLLRSKDAMLTNLKEALERECQENDEAIETLENKILSDKAKYVAIIDDLKVEYERLRVNTSSLESKVSSGKAEAAAVSAELAKANDSLFAAEKAKLQAEERLSTVSAKVSRLEKDSEEKDRKLSMSADQTRRLEEAQGALEARLQEADAGAMKAQATIRQLQADLAAAKGRLDVSEAAGEIEDLRSQLESEKEIRKMVDASNAELNAELRKIKKHLEDASSQRQTSQSEKNELLAAVDPLKLELEKEKKLRGESDVIIAKLEAEITELNDEISQADQNFDKTLKELREKCDTAMRSMSIEIQELDNAKRAMEAALWKARSEKDEVERQVAELQRKLADPSRPVVPGTQDEDSVLSDAPVDTSDPAALAERVTALQRALQRAEERLHDKDSLVTSLQARLDSQTDRINSDSKRQKTLASEIDILRSELERETTKRKALEKDKKKFNAEVAQVVDDLNKMTAQRDVLLEDKIRLDREVEELKDRIGTMKEMHEHEIAAVKIQQQNSVKDLSIRVKEMNDTNNRLKRRTTVVENLLSLKGASGENAKTIQELEMSLKEAVAYIDQEKQQSQELMSRLQAEESRANQLTKVCEKLEQTISGTNSQLELEVRANQKLMDEQRNFIQEISQLKTKLAEASKERFDAEVKLRAREADLGQASFELSELTATKKALAEQLKALREDLEQSQSSGVKLESSKKRLQKDLDEARAQVLLTGDEKVAALAQQLLDREKEITTLREEVQENAGAQLGAEIKLRKELEAQLEALQEKYNQEHLLKAKMESEGRNAQRLNEELEAMLEKKKAVEAELDQQVNKERVAKLDMEVEISRLRAESIESSKKLDSLQMINLDLLVDAEDLKRKMDADVAEIAKLQKDLKQAIQDRIATQEKLAEVIQEGGGGGGGGGGAAPGLRSNTSISRKPSMRQNWQGGSIEKKTMQDMRSMQQALDVTIKAKTQLEKTNQELLVDKESLASELTQANSKVAELKEELARLQQAMVESQSRPRSASHVTEEDRRSRRESKATELTKKTSGDPAKIAGPIKHNFTLASFGMPTKSHLSGRLLFGALRQGLRCENCGYACAAEEREQVPDNCGVHHGTPPVEAISKGSGYLRVPKPKGIRQGWKRVLVVEDAGLLYVFAADGDKGSSVSAVEFIVDVTSESFKVAEVNPHHVIHASPKDIPAIFQVSATEGGDDRRMLLAGSPADKAEWMAYLQGLHKKAAASEDAHFEPVVRVSDAIKLPPNVLCSKRWISAGGREKYLLGTEDGIFVSKKGGFEKLLEFESVNQMDLIAHPPLFIALGGKTKHVRVWPLQVLEDGPGWPIVLEVTQGCYGYALGKMDETVVLAVAVKKRILILRVDDTKRFKKLKELTTPDTCSGLKFFKGKLCASFGSKVRLYDLKKLSDAGEGDLPSKSDSALGWMSAASPPLVPMAVFKIKNEYLLCYNAVGFFVNESGKHTRSGEMKWLSTPLAFGLLNSRLLVFNAEFIEVYAVSTGKRLENIPLHGISAVDPTANLLCAHSHIYSLRYVGERLDGAEEVTDDNVVVDTTSTVFDPAGEVPDLPTSWSRSDSLFLREAIQNADLGPANSKSVVEEREGESEEDEEDEEEAPVNQKGASRPPDKKLVSASAPAASSSSLAVASPSSPAANKSEEDLKSKMSFLLDW